jgi:hypothetical protein
MSGLVFHIEEKLRRGAASERAYGTRRGTKPRRVNPMSGTGME